MKVLLTNDDGYQAEGLRTLCATLATEYEVYVAAPLKQQSGAGHSMHTFRKIAVQPVDIPGAKRAWAIDGSPVDAVKIGVEKFLHGEVDCVISGINQGANLGTDVFYSGTVGAATEAAILGIPAIAVSLNSHQPLAGYQAAAQVTARILSKVFFSPSEFPLLLNINIPDVPLEEIRGVHTARLGARRYYNGLVEQTPTEGKLEFLLDGTCEELSHHPDDDVQLVRQGYVTLTPLTLDRTDHRAIQFYQTLIGETL